MIDLHLHTTASDGRCTPRELVTKARAAGLTIIAVTDHDTFASVDEAAAHAAAEGIRLIPGIEITAVWNELDVHVLGYGLDPSDASLGSFLERQRADRLRRVRLMLERLDALGASVDPHDVYAPVAGRTPDAIGRPQVARALVRAGHAVDTNEAFDRYLAEGAPAYVARFGSTPADVVRLIVRAGGIASLAHPGLLAHDELIPELVSAGMQAIETYHPDHDGEAVSRYREMASRYSIAVTGGSDFHADAAHGGAVLGAVTLPQSDFLRLEQVCRNH